MTETDTNIPQKSADAGRRRLLVGAGTAACIAGGVFSWWQGAAAVTDSSQTEPFPGFWDQKWDTPQGTVLRLQEFRGKPLLINFWATWCPPCIAELPLINEFYVKQKARGWQVIGLAVDRPAAVQGFLQKTPLNFPIALAGPTGGDIATKLGNPTGALPFSIALGSQGGIAQRKLGRLHPADLDAWAQVK
jgi:thiol-disulfide isomerase/thioredoxin